MNLLAMLSHIDILPVIYGVTIFLGLAIMIVKIKKGYFVSAVIDIAVFYLVFKLHGGSMSGAFAATIAALLCGLFLPLVIRR